MQLLVQLVTADDLDRMVPVASAHDSNRIKNRRTTQDIDRLHVLSLSRYPPWTLSSPASKRASDSIQHTSIRRCPRGVHRP